MGVPAAEATKIQHYIESMYASKMYDDKELQPWEIKASADKTWDAAKTHFVTIYKSKEEFNAETSGMHLTLQKCLQHLQQRQRTHQSTTYPIQHLHIPVTN
jgi:hypothetical protein